MMPNNTDTLFLLQKLAEQGNAAAQYNLAVSYIRGEGIPQNYAKAVGWCRLAAEQGFAKAQYKLGVMYDIGCGVPKDDVAAVSWYRKASEQEEAVAQYRLGRMFSMGRGVSRNYEEAAKWYCKTAEKDYADAYFSLGVICETGWGLPKDYEASISWYFKAAEKGNVPAQFSLGMMFEKGLGVQKDLEQAYKWFRLASDNGHYAAGKIISGQCLLHDPKDRRMMGMAQNIEIKSIMRREMDEVLEMVRLVADSPEPIVLHQTDTYFKANEGRLKLRVINGEEAQLIAYARDDEKSGPKLSCYKITRVEDADVMRAMLADSLGVVAEVQKCRRVFFKDNVRIHLDEVEGLGQYLELEVVLDPGVSVESGTAKAEELMSHLHIVPDDLIEGSYLDMVVAKMI